MPETPQLPHPNSGDRILPAFIDVVDVVNRFSRGYALDYDTGNPDPGRPVNDAGPVVTESFLGVVADSGPFDEADYADARYWVDRYRPNGERVSDADSLEGAADPYPDAEQTVTAFNLSEYAQGTHTLAVGTLVYVFAVYTVGTVTDAEGTPTGDVLPLKRYVFVSGAAPDDAPEFFGQVRMGVANLTAGWALLPLVNVVP